MTVGKQFISKRGCCINTSSIVRNRTDKNSGRLVLLHNARCYIHVLLYTWSVRIFFGQIYESMIHIFS